MGYLGYTAPERSLAVNFFTNTKVEDGFLSNRPKEPVIVPRGYVVFEARMDLVCAVSSCPNHLAGSSWAINALGRTTEILIELL